ncbi:hypothetical protein OG689_10745 [Kitasatospora sp. NBC_00240]|uniref:hypothetical protein n=1 Tax=Kitasatospora sp. NBC_00240 TaxID=2903567 RepID=UPI00224E9FE0|nr:hypothetical protein [Kitasatospora sp. NBC_00240]MCX5209761.1 hypothetical protein [Kitasatospora sp. NBC_00240]
MNPTSTTDHPRAAWYPLDWITAEQFVEARRLVNAIVKTTRTAINHAVRTGTDEQAALHHRAKLNAGNKYATALHQRTDELAQAWTDITAAASAMGVARDEAARLAEIRSEMLNNREVAL